MKKVLIATLSMFVITFSQAGLAGGDVDAGKQKSVTCAACHGADGNSAAAGFPKLAGQHEAYIVKQLQNFKNDVRVNASMSPQAKPLSDQDMQDLAAYYASQTGSAGKADKTKAKLGEALYKGGNMTKGIAACAACHGPVGNGNSAAKFPRLAGQHAEYTKSQLVAFSKGERANDAGMMMRNIAENMSEEEMDAVSEYIAGLSE